jgi:CubicO group peptidase (beta-lactamase class C family)
MKKNSVMKKAIFCLSLFISQHLFAQITTHQQALIDSLLVDYQNTRQFSGVVLIGKKEKILYQQAVGYADREKQIKNAITTNFNIASMGKTFTATMILQLVQEGKLQLNQSIEKILPGTKIRKADSIAVFHLLTHTSGIGNYMMHPKFEVDRNKLKSLTDVMPYVEGMEPTMSSVGSAFDYSNSGFIVLGRIIETITGKDYQTNLKERIFTPSRITNSYLHYPATFQAPAEAVPYIAYTAKTYTNAVKEEFPAFSDGGMQSNANDLFHFANALLNDKLLSPAMRDTMWKGRNDMGRGGSYGYGWIDNQNEYGKKIYSHDGGGKGFSSDLKIVKEDGYVIVVLINGRVNSKEISNNILSILYKNAYNKPEKYFETVLTEVMEEKGFSYIQQHYNDLLQQSGYEKTPSPWVIIKFSDMLVNLGEINNAFAMHEIGRREFPAEASMYSISGQLYHSQKQWDEARKWFMKALEINPNDEFAKMMLANLKVK